MTLGGEGRKLLAVGCSHSPYLLERPEAWPRWRELILGLCKRINPHYQDPPQLREELAAGAEAQHWERCQKAYGVLRDYLEAERPDAMIVVGDDQAENFPSRLVPTFALYTGPQVDGYPFFNAPQNNWGEPREQRYIFPCAQELARYLLGDLIGQGFDLTSCTDFSRGRNPDQVLADPRALVGFTPAGLAHAHINVLMFLNKEAPIPIIPIHVNCYGSEGGADFPPGPSPNRCYDLGQALARSLARRPEKVVLVASSSWSHTQLTRKTNYIAFDEEFDWQNLRLLEQGEGWKLGRYATEELEEAGDHEFRSWIVVAGAMGQRKARIVDAFPSYCSTSFKTFAIWA